MALSTGTKNNQIAAGLNQRILGDDKANKCTHPNRYRADFGHFDPADPRIVQLAISPYGSFSNTGNDTTVPITNFGTFYITGWKEIGLSQADRCFMGLLWSSERHGCLSLCSHVAHKEFLSVMPRIDSHSASLDQRSSRTARRRRRCGPRP